MIKLVWKMQQISKFNLWSIDTKLPTWSGIQWPHGGNH